MEVCTKYNQHQEVKIYEAHFDKMLRRDFVNERLEVEDKLRKDIRAKVMPGDGEKKEESKDNLNTDDNLYLMPVEPEGEEPEKQNRVMTIRS